MNFFKRSRFFIFLVLFLTILLGSLFDVYLLFQHKEISNLYNLTINVVFIAIFHWSEKAYAEKIAIFPMTYYYVALIFAFCSTYLGSFLNYYERFAWWDTLLHFTSGILLGYLSIVAVNLLFHNYISTVPNLKVVRNLIVIGVLVAISIGVFWEFYEFTFDYITGGNMQRGFYVQDIDVVLDNHVRSSGRFIDPSLLDTMKDLFLSTIGAIISGVGAYFQIRRNIKGTHA